MDQICLDPQDKLLPTPHHDMLTCCQQNTLPPQEKKVPVPPHDNFWNSPDMFRMSTMLSKSCRSAFYAITIMRPCILSVTPGRVKHACFIWILMQTRQGLISIGYYNRAQAAINSNIVNHMPEGRMLSSQNVIPYTFTADTPQHLLIIGYTQYLRVCASTVMMSRNGFLGGPRHGLLGKQSRQPSDWVHVCGMMINIPGPSGHKWLYTRKKKLKHTSHMQQNCNNHNR